MHPKVQNVDIDGLVIDGAPFAIKLSGDSASHIRNVTVTNSTFTNMASSTVSVKNADTRNRMMKRRATRPWTKPLAYTKRLRPRRSE